MRALRGSGTRKGMFIPMVVATLAVLMASLFYRLSMSSWTLRLAGRGAGGAVAEQLALSVIAEALWHFHRESNDPGSRLFTKLRAGLIGGTSPVDVGEFLLPKLLEESLKNLNLTSSLEGAQVEGLRAVLRHPDYPDALYLECTVRLSLPGGTLVRTVREVHPFGVTALFVPPPLDQPTVALLGVGMFDAHRGSLSHWLQGIQRFNRIQLAFRNLLDQVHASLPNGSEEKITFALVPDFHSSGDPMEFPPDEARLLKGMMDREPWRRHEQDMGRLTYDMLLEDIYWEGTSPILFHVSGLVDPQTVLDEGPALPEATLQDIEPSDSALLNFESALDLDTFNPNHRLGEVRKKSALVIEALANDWNQLLRDYQLTQEDRVEEEDGGLVKFLDRGATILSECNRAIASGTLEWNAFSREVLGETRAPVVEGIDFAQRVRESGRAPPFFQYADKIRDFKQIFSGKGGVNGMINLRDQVYLDAVQEAQKRNQPAPEPVEVALGVEEWEGQSFIDATDVPRLKLERLTLKYSLEDRIVLKARSLTLDGPVHASLFVDALRLHSAASHEGAMVVADYPFVADDKDDRNLKGTLKFDPRHIAGVFQSPDFDPFKESRICKSSYQIVLHPKLWDRTITKGEGE